ncbi:hypothetical protein QZH41_012668, partial [Actinostola sp. cb2023]
SCPSCSLSDNLGPIYCSSDYAIRAKVTKYRHARNRTMYYANLITTYKTTTDLPNEVLIRVEGEHCPCPPLVVGVEYLMAGTTKATFTGKTRLALSLNSFVKEWVSELDDEVDAAKQECGLPVVLVPPVTVPTKEGRKVLILIIHTIKGCLRVVVLCPSCSSSKISETQQKRICRSDQVFRGRVLSSYETSANRTHFLVALVTTFKSAFEIPDKITTRLAYNACLCTQLSVGQDYLIVGRVKKNRKGKSRMILTRKSFIQDWQDSLYEKIDHMKAQCGNPVLELTLEKLTVTRRVPVVTTPTTEKSPNTEFSGMPFVSTTKKYTVIPTTKTETCPPCSVSHNIQEFCSNENVFRVQVFKKYRTSTNQTAYHVNVKNTYKSTEQIRPVVLLVECHCPKLRVGVEYVVMGFVRRKWKGPSTMALSSGSFVQQWSEGLEEELQSLRSDCKNSSVDGVSLVQLISNAGSKVTKMTMTSPTKSQSVAMETVTMPTSQPTVPSISVTSSSPLSTTLSTGNTVASALGQYFVLGCMLGRKCPPCQTSKKRNRLYCISDY